MGRSTQRVVIVGAVVAAALAMAAGPSTAETQPVPVEQAQAPAPPALLDLGARAYTAGAHVTTARHADVDTSLLAPGVERTVSVDVIETQLQVHLAPIDSGAAGWSAWNGTIAGEPDSSATVVRDGDDVAGLFTTTSGSYRIRTTAPGRQVVQEISGPFPEALDDHPAPPGVLDLGVGPDAAGAAPAADVPTPSGDVPAYPVIDVLVGYTAGALADAATTNGMNSEIALAISVANTAYEDSGVAGRLRLAGTTALTQDFLFDDEHQLGLAELTNPSDGNSDQVHTRRNATGADLVSVLVHDPSSCGVGWLLQGTTGAAANSPYGFSLVDYSCAVDNYSFPHELGHNMGLSHDRAVETNPYFKPLFPYSFGYVNVAEGWRTIMAYNDQCAAASTYCTRLGRFSNPDQTYLGDPLGRPSAGSNPADNRRALNSTQAFVSSWRAQPAPFTSWSRFVAQQYRDFQGRSPTSAESTTDTKALTSGAETPQGYIDDQLNGTFGAGYAPVARLYFAYFLRSPDIGGLDYWVRKYRAGTKLTAISSNFAASNEFKTKYGTLSNRAFVLQIYRNLFDRTGDTSGVNYWTGKLDAKTKTRGGVMVGFSESSEFKRVRSEEISVVLLYRSLLQRSAAPSEFASQVGRLQGSTTVQRLILEILDSSEYAGRVTT